VTNVQEHLLRQCGAISVDQARASGLSQRQVDHKVASGEWFAVRRGVYRLAAAVPLPETGLWTGLLALGPDALLTEAGALWWWDVTPEPPSCWTFVSPRSSRRGDAGLRVRRAFVDRRDQHRHRGVRVVSKPWAVLTTAAAWENDQPGRGIALIDRAKQTRHVRQHDLQGAFERHPGCWGSATMRRLLLRTGDGAHSELERLAVSLLRGAGITGFTPNLTVRLGDGSSAEIDIAFPDRRIAIELDGYAFHSGAEAFRRDVRRGNRLLADGWTVRRFTWEDMLTAPDAFVSTVRELLLR
jgi:very-short-patch-repair endonuclease